MILCNNVGCVIVTYNPPIEELKKNLALVKKQIQACVVVDNGSENRDQIQLLCNDLSIEPKLLERNVGIAAAQNIGFKFFETTGEIEWVLTLDQDSTIPSGLIKSYLDSSKINEASTAILTCSYTSEDWTEAQRRKIESETVHAVSKVDLVISSGNLVRVSAWKLVGGFDEYLFIDLVDYDFDVKLKLAGYLIWQVNSISISHSIGVPMHRPILSRLLLLRADDLLADHPAMRQYYIYRNSIIFDKRYAKIYPKSLLIFRTILATRRILAYSNSLEKYHFAFRGIRSGYRYDPLRDDRFQDFLTRINYRMEKNHD